jgi:hypothetical protein
VSRHKSVRRSAQDDVFAERPTHSPYQQPCSLLNLRRSCVHPKAIAILESQEDGRFLFMLWSRDHLEGRSVSGLWHPATWHAAA